MFNNGTSAERVWRAVQVKRAVEDVLKREAREREGRDRLIAVHSSRLILHGVFRVIGRSRLDGANTDFNSALKSIPSLVSKLLESAIQEVSSEHANSYPAAVFRTATKCKSLIDAMLASVSA